MPAAPSSVLALAVVIAPGLTLQQAKEEGADRQPLCQLAEHVAAMQPVPMQQDPVFRRPTPIAREKLQAVRAMFAVARNPRDKQLAVNQLRDLLKGPDAAVLARLAMQANDAAFRKLVLRYGMALARQHPRLAGFVGSDPRNKDPELAALASHFLLATRCDTPSNYGLDALAHSDVTVRRAASIAVLEQASTTTGTDLVDRVLAHVADRESDAALQGQVLRWAGRKGWLSAAAPLRRLLARKGVDKTTRCEAEVALARITSQAPRKAVGQLLASKSPWMRLCGIRAIAAGMTRRPREGADQLRALLSDKAVAADPLGGGKAWQVNEAARTATTLLDRR